ncbi:MAG TPA: DNA repair exonuclease [Gemmatimonadales bacterium]|nr:DNA repair exonuclease [Gemmatimonadales bacterium]
MKLAHLADLHLGFRQYHRQTPTGLNQREADAAEAFRRAIDGVIAAAPEIVIIAGDLFHSVRPTNQAILVAYQQLYRLREALPSAPVILISGNHDSPRSQETGSILQLFKELKVHVVDQGWESISFPQLDLRVMAVSHEALVGPERPKFQPEGSERYHVLVLHGEVEGVFPTDRTAVDFGGASLQPGELTGENWSYVALGHYHVQHQVGPRVWYSGSLDYVSTNPWGELKDEAERKVEGKAWLLVDLESGKAERKPVPLARRVIDLPRLDGIGLVAAELDALVAEAVANVPGGITDEVVRQVVYNVPRSVGRAMNYQTVRAYKAQALHYQLDLRRPEIQRQVGVGSPGRRQTLPEIVENFLKERPDLPPDIERDALVQTGTQIMTAIEREWAQGG